MTDRRPTESSAATAGLTDAKRRLLDRLKRSDTATAPELALEFGLTDTALRQHLEALEAAGLVERTAPDRATGRGRPPVHWRLTASAESAFPDRHADLTTELIDSIRAALGDDGLDRVVASRAERQRQAYAERMPATSPLRTRVELLAAMRTAEGYLADVVDDGPDGLVLVEHHCPVQQAAAACTGLCAAELTVFREVLGPDVSVERESHLLAGDRRCAYRVRTSR